MLLRVSFTVFEFMLLMHGLSAQPFTRITTGEIAADSVASWGCSWVDFDNDDDLDIFISNTTDSSEFLYRNDGQETFVQIPGGDFATSPGSIGNSWADYDNDGDLDCFTAGTPSALYRNDGNGDFTRVTAGDIGATTDMRGWACAWGDYDNDGYVDLVISHPANFVGSPSTPNHMFHNDGPPNFAFTKIDTGVVVTGLAPYTVPTWYDYDQDGDIDLFIGSGPANGSLAPDFLYRNLLKETGTAWFERLNEAGIASDRRDGQVINWIDYDNDRDLDMYVTNWTGTNPPRGFRNQLYENLAGIAYASVLTGEIVTDAAASLANTWGDFDNDGDLDVFVANARLNASVQGLDRYYQNNGDGTFTSIKEGEFVSTAQSNSGACAGDYDRDGDLDLLVVSPSRSTPVINLFRNDLMSANSWIDVKCVGVTSNRAAIGARLQAKTTRAGNSVWQMREVTSQNTFCGQNALNVHWGLGTATRIDSLIIDWPSGMRDVYTNVAANGFFTATEGQSLTTAVARPRHSLPEKFELRQNYPNPFNPSTSITYSLPKTARVVLKVYDALGHEVKVLVDQVQSAGAHTLRWNATDAQGKLLPSGIYFYRMQAAEFSHTLKMILLR